MVVYSSISGGQDSAGRILFDQELSPKFIRRAGVQNKQATFIGSSSWSDNGCTTTLPS
jgi:hypothetical protein